MKTEEQKQLNKITNLDCYALKNDEIAFVCNEKTMKISTKDKNLLSIKEQLTSEDIEELQKYIFEFWGNLYYPNFKNEILLDTIEEFQFARKDIIFDMFKVLIETSDILNQKEKDAFYLILYKLCTFHYDIYHFYRLHKLLSIFLFLNYFFGEYWKAERAVAIGAIEVANTFVKTEDDDPLIDLQYIMHCAAKNNYAHIGNYLKTEIMIKLEHILEELVQNNSLRQFP